MSTWLRLQRAWRCYMLIKFNVLIDRAADKHRAAQQNASRSKFMQHKKEGWWWSVEAERHSRRRDALWGRDVNPWLTQSESLLNTEQVFVFLLLAEAARRRFDHEQSQSIWPWCNNGTKTASVKFFFHQGNRFLSFNNDIRPFHKACHKPVFVRWTACWLWRNIFLIFPKWESLEMINSHRRTSHHLIKLLPHKATSAATIKTKTFGLNSRFKDDKDKIKTSKETLWFDLIWFDLSYSKIICNYFEDQVGLMWMFSGVFALLWQSTEYLWTRHFLRMLFWTLGKNDQRFHYYLTLYRQNN